MPSKKFMALSLKPITQDFHNSIALHLRHQSARMTTIRKAVPEDAAILAELGARTFVESHGRSAPQKDIDAYRTEKYTVAVMQEELRDASALYHLIFSDDIPAGYSKIMLNAPYEGSEYENIAKLERIYILEAFYDRRLGSALFNFNVDLAKEAGQRGIWLYTWKENARAIAFYRHKGFVINGSHDFRLSPTHTNPNHRMLLLF
jgi:ribosomal protein S18 acetylase RimI-like enzyme